MAESPERDHPSTFVGAWLKADALDRRDDRARFMDDLRRTGGWTAGRVAVVDNASRLAVAHHFTRPPAMTEISDLVLAVLANFPQSDHLRYLEIEWKVRAALGEEMPLDVLNPGRSRLVSRLLFGYLSDRDGFSERLVDSLLVAAERKAVAEGHDPIPQAEYAETGVRLSSLT